MRQLLTPLLVFATLLSASWVALYLSGRRLDRELVSDAVKFFPACATTLRNLRKLQTPRRVKVALWLALLYVLSPIDPVPDFIPVIGLADEVIVIALALRYSARQIGVDVVRTAWPGESRLLDRLLG